MSTILYITSSPRGSQSFSTKVAQELVSGLQQADSGARLLVRDLVGEPLPHADANLIAAIASPAGPQTDAERAVAVQSDILIDELTAADTVVIAAPMINFTIPSTLKTWIDYVTRSGRTFSYSEAGPKGLMTGKKVYLVLARGGVYSGDNKAFDFQLPYLRHVLAFIGMTNVETIEVEGIAFGPEAAEKSVAAALAKARTIASARQAA
jgi:FMN-dependent NADH-azoreductase